MDNSLNNVQLNASMLQALYGHTLVELKENKIPTQPDKKPQSFPIKHLGNNARNILVIVRNDKHDYFSEAENAFLTRLMKACQLELDDVAIVNFAREKTKMEDIISELKPVSIISFGTGSGTELFTMGNVDGTKYLNAPELNELILESEKSKQLKGKLWAELKMMFDLK